MPLFHMTSKVIDGFYASEIFVSAFNREDAINLAMQGYDRFVKQGMDDLYLHPITKLCEDFDDDFKEKSQDARRAFLSELQNSLKMAEHAAVIFERS